MVPGTQGTGRAFPLPLYGFLFAGLSRACYEFDLILGWIGMDLKWLD